MENPLEMIYEQNKLILAQQAEILSRLSATPQVKDKVPVIEIAKQVFRHKSYVIKACDDLKVKRVMVGNKTAVTGADAEKVIEYIARKAS